jgi:lipopolysaccharide transport system ATP-binding protein
VGLGFHPEFSGYENILAALAYNGLPRRELDRVVKDVVDFVELGDFLHQPMKTYSLGMQARVMFASATAIQPDTLIVDEVLGAGDAYFSAKSALRMQQLAASGCTLLLVSHSMQQIIQFCERAVWLEKGAIVMEGDTLSVVKAYEEFVDHLRAKTEREQISAHQLIDSDWFRVNVLEKALNGGMRENEAGAGRSVSRWAGEGGLRISSVRLRSGGREVRSIDTGDEVQFEIDVTAERAGTFECRYVVLLFTEDGRPLTRHLSNGELIT